MYAVIKTGGKQYRVAEGQLLDVERLAVPAGEGDGAGGELSFQPVLVVDGDTVLAAPGDLAGARVTAKVVGASAGPKITGFTYKPKSNNRRRWGHRQHYASIQITGIQAAGAPKGG